MKRQYILQAVMACFFLVGLSFSVAAQTALLEYSEGTVERLGTGGKWQKLDIGTSIPLSTVRLRENGLAEFRIDGTGLHLNKDGSYDLVALNAQLKQQKNTSASTIASGKVTKLLNNSSTPTTRTAAGGVRAAEQSPTASVEWSTGDDEGSSSDSSSLDQIRALIAKAQYDQALSKVNLVLKNKSADPTAMHLLKAQIFSLQSRSAAAVRELGRISITAGQPHYEEYVLLSASQSLEVQDWDTAFTRATEGQSLNGDTDLTQTYKLIQAIALRGKGQNAQSTEILKQIVAVAPDTETGKEAARLLK